MTSEPYDIFPATSMEAPPAGAGRPPTAGERSGTGYDGSATNGSRSVDGVEAAKASNTVPSPSSLNVWVRRLWGAHGFFGSLLAIAIAYIGQMALLNENDYVTSTRNYILAIIILILSFTNPSWELVRRLRAGKKTDAGQTFETPAAEPGQAISNANAGALVANLPPNGGVATATSTLQTPQQAATTDVPLAAPLPTRKLRSKAVVVEPAPIATPDPPSIVTNAGTERVPTTLASPANLWRQWITLRTRLGWWFTIPGLALTAGLAIWSALLILKDLGDPLAGWLWAASLTVLLLTFLGASEGQRKDGLLPTPMSDFFSQGIPTIPIRWEFVLAGGMMLLAIYLRLNNLEFHPGIFGDEGEQGMNVRSIVEGRMAEGAPITGHTAPIFGLGWWGVPNLSFYVWAFTIRLFGDSMFGLRMFSAISGIVAVWYIYRIGRLLWGQRVGLIAGVMLAVSPLALQFSKFANVSSATSALWVVGFFYFFLALRHRKWSDWILAGFFWSINLYFYPAGKLIIAFIGVAGLYCLIRWRLEFFKRYLLGFVLLGVTFALTFMPYYIFSAKYDNPPWGGFAGRAGETSIFSPQNQQGTFARFGIPYDPAWAGRSTLENIRINPVPWAQLVYQQSRETMDVLYRRGDQVFYYRLGEMNRPVFSPFWAVLALLGLAYGAWKWWDARYGLAFLWFGIGLSASILTIDTPNLQRFTDAWPAAMLFPAILVDRVFASSWPLSRQLARKWATVPIAALLVFLAVISYREYFIEYAATCPYCRDTLQARYAQALGQDYKAYQLGTGNGFDSYFGYGSTRFAAKGVEGVEMLTPADSLPLIDTNGKGAAFIVCTNNTDYLPMLRLMYPGGEEQVEIGADGQTYFTSYKVSREQVMQSHTSNATYGKPGDSASVSRSEPAFGTATNTTNTTNSTNSTNTTGSGPALAPLNISYPTDATWQGGLVAPTYGTYTFALDGAAGNVTLTVDEKPVLTVPTLDAKTGVAGRQVNMVLAKGVHDLRLSGTLADANSKLQLLWSSSGGPLAPIEARFLYNGSTGGLSAEIGPLVGQDQLKAADPFGTIPLTERRSDPFLGFREGSLLFRQSPFFGRWQGTLNTSVEGDYTFASAVVGQNLVMIDGKTVTGDGPDGVGSGMAHLTAGSHRVDFRYIGSGVPIKLEWYWTVPGRPQPELVPPTALRPLERSWLAADLPNAPAAQLPPPEISSADIRQPVLTLGEGLVKPKGIAVDKDGNIYVGDRGNHRIVVYGADGKKLREWGKALPTPPEGQQPAPFQSGEFGEISDVAVTQDGTVYVFDSAMRVQAFKTTGEYIGSFEPEQLGLYGPNGIAAEVPSKETEGRNLGLFIAVTGQSRILKLPSVADVLAGKATLAANAETAKGVAKALLDQPIDAVEDHSGTGYLYEIDLGNGNDRITRLKPQAGSPGPAREWEIDQQWAVALGKADGGSRLALSPDGKTLYMSDPDRHRVAVLDVVTGELHYFGAEGAEPGRFGMPSGIAVGPDGRVYVVDSVNNNVQVFTP